MSKPQKVLSEKEIKILLSDYCARKERSLWDIEQKLKDYTLPDEIKAKVIDYLRGNNFFSEERYAQAFVNDKFRFDKWGKFKIRLALKQKKVSESVIQNALESIPADLYKQLLKDEIAKKIRSTKANSNYELKGKLYRFAAGRGFEPDVIGEVLDDLVND